jgi:hypothetical protein
MTHPYRGRPDYTYWKRAVATPDLADLDPVVHAPFTITPSDAVATSGSCFAQHIARALQRQGYNYLVTETAPEGVDAETENYGVFTARFGNVYTVRQLRQLLLRAYGIFCPQESAWEMAPGVFVDPFRPNISSTGWPSPKAVEAAREEHFDAVRTMFETCDVFVFTLGLTEGWIRRLDGAVYPLAPGAVFDCRDEEYHFVNFSVAEMTEDLLAFIDDLRMVNPGVRVILTVSPVPLIATAEDKHVLVSNTYSKSALRVVADEVSRARDDVAYFPSYEIITGPPTASRYYAADLRSVLDVGVAHVMSIFSKHFLNQDAVPHKKPASEPPRAVAAERLRLAALEFEAVSNVVCDEEGLVDDD